MTINAGKFVPQGLANFTSKLIPFVASGILSLANAETALPLIEGDKPQSAAGLVVEPPMLNLERVYIGKGSLADACIRKLEKDYLEYIKLGPLESNAIEFSFKHTYEISIPKIEDLICLQQAIDLALFHGVRKAKVAQVVDDSGIRYGFDYQRFAQLSRFFSLLAQSEEQKESMLDLRLVCGALEICTSSEHSGLASSPRLQELIKQFADICVKNLDLLLQYRDKELHAAMFKSWQADQKNSSRTFDEWYNKEYTAAQDRYCTERKVAEKYNFVITN